MARASRARRPSRQPASSRAGPLIRALTEGVTIKRPKAPELVHCSQNSWPLSALSPAAAAAATPDRAGARPARHRKIGRSANRVRSAPAGRARCSATRQKPTSRMSMTAIKGAPCSTRTAAKRPINPAPMTTSAPRRRLLSAPARMKALTGQTGAATCIGTRPRQANPRRKLAAVISRRKPPPGRDASLSFGADAAVTVGNPPKTKAGIEKRAARRTEISARSKI